MVIHLPSSSNIACTDSGSGSGSSSDDDEQNWDDWVSDSQLQQPCKSLFEDKIFPSLSETVAHDRATFGIDINNLCSALSLDVHGRIRLINYIRKNNFVPDEVKALTGTEPWFSTDEYLIPTLENDPYLQSTSEDWSDSEDGESSTDPQKRIRSLEKKLELAKDLLAEYRNREFLSKQLELSGIVEPMSESGQNGTPKPARDDDSHYFESYAENDIHAVMIQDKVRTSTYADFILTNPTLFSNAVVLDVGCGTGILSLLAARGGAKRVIAVDASDIAGKAAQIVKANDLEDIITVIHGKIEDITLPKDINQVDIIISEWMGYALLYESMLDSVLCARDRFLKSDGLMAPSQCKIMLALCDGSAIYKDRMGFWNDVYGFDMSAMVDDLYNEAIIDVVGEQAVLSEPCTIKDLLLSSVTSRQLDFKSSFYLISTADKRTAINSFVLYFDTFFTITGEPVSPSTKVKTVKEGEAVLAELWPVGGKPPPKRRQSQGREKEKITSFSTGPQSSPTHWKQTLFFLREPIVVVEGSIVSGTFHCRKSETNSRELDVEIHYSLQEDVGSPASDVIVQMYKVR